MTRSRTICFWTASYSFYSCWSSFRPRS